MVNSGLLTAYNLNLISTLDDGQLGVCLGLCGQLPNGFNLDKRRN